MGILLPLVWKAPVTWVSDGCHMTPVRCDYGVGMMYHTALIGWCMRNWSVLNWLSCPGTHVCVGYSHVDSHCMPMPFQMCTCTRSN